MTSLGRVISTVLMAGFSIPAAATFDGQNGRIVYHAFTPVAPGEVNTLAIFDGNGTRLTFPDPASTKDTDPAYSPDGKSIAYIRTDHTLDDTFIRILDPDGTTETIFGSDSISEAAVLSAPSYSADGQKIAFQVTVPGDLQQGGIFTIDADGSNPVRAWANESSIDETALSPQWSPHGRKIAFRCRYRAVGSTRIDDLCTIDTSTGESRQLPITIMDNGVEATPHFRPLGRPIWTPDGQRLVFVANYTSGDSFQYQFPFSGGSGPYPLGEIFSIRKDGTALKRLTRSRPVASLKPDGSSRRSGEFYFHDVVVSPDGASIMAAGYHTRPNGSEDYFGLWRMRADGTGQTLVRKLPLFGTAFDWQAITDRPGVYVTDGHGNPLDGLRVELRSVEDPGEVLHAEPLRAGNGNYVFENAALGRYVVRVTLEDVTGVAWPLFDIRHDVPRTAVTPVDLSCPPATGDPCIEPATIYVEVDFNTGRLSKEVRFDDRLNGANYLGSNLSSDNADRLDDLANIYFNVRRYVDWATDKLNPLIPHVTYVAFSDLPGLIHNDPLLEYYDSSGIIVMGTAASEYENRDGHPDLDHLDDDPENGEWHEFTHHLIHNNVSYDFNCTDEANHLGYPNPSTCDSVSEGLASFFPAVAQREITGQADSWYGRLGDLENPIKAWGPRPRPDRANETEEDLAVAALLWDLVDVNIDTEITNVIGANGAHTLPIVLRDDVQRPLSELWATLTSRRQAGLPDLATVSDLHSALSSPATGDAAIDVDLDFSSPADVSRLDLLFLMHGFYGATDDLDAPGLHWTEHYDVAAAQRDVPSAPRNAKVGLTSHHIHDTSGTRIGEIIPRLNTPANPDARIEVHVRDASGTPLSGATVHLEQPQTAFVTTTDPPQRFGPSVLLGSGDGVLLHYEPPFYIDYPLAAGAPLPACDDPAVTHVSVTISATLNGHTSIDQPTIDNCEYWQAVLSGTVPAASVTLTFPAEAAPPVTTAFTALVPAENGGPAYWSVELNCTDSGSGEFAAGCARTEYRVNGGAVSTYDRPLRSAPPLLELEYRSVDAAGNEEAFRVVTNFDSDGDGLSDADEVQRGSDPLDVDSDDDGASDPSDNCLLLANPDQQNSDADLLGDACDDDDDDDGLSDEAEIAGGTDPRNPDTDGDGLRDPDESSLGTHPLDPDSDDDGLVDGDEVERGANPLDSDSDDDGLLDGDEVDRGTNPLDADSDDDGVGDGVDNCPALANPGQEDRDSDGSGDVCDAVNNAGVQLVGVTHDVYATAKETLFALDTSNASATFLMALGNGDLGEAIAFNPDDGLLYHASGYASDLVWESIDLATLSIVSSGPMVGGPGADVLAATYDPATGRFLVVDDSRSLWDFTAAGAVTHLGTVVSAYHGLAFAGGTLYAAARNDDRIDQVNPATGGWIGELKVTLAGTPIDGLGGLATDPRTGTVWAVLNPPGSNTQYLATVDLSTGAATAVGTLSDDFAGIAFVPEPGSTLGLGAGAITVSLLHRRRTRAMRRV